jgi:hypothetical protein
LTKTRPKKVAIGIRGKPCPNDQPGYIRIDSIHQGGQDKRKGIYHINAVDAVTQIQVIVTAERMDEAFMLSTIQQILESFPFKIPRFHADNGGEYINDNTAALLDKLLIEFTKSKQYLKPDINSEQLDAFSKKTNDNEAAEQLNTARDTLFKQLHERHDLRA